MRDGLGQQALLRGVCCFVNLGGVVYVYQHGALDMQDKVVVRLGVYDVREDAERS